jgi:hypothetical protein
MFGPDIELQAILRGRVVVESRKVLPDAQPRRLGEIGKGAHGRLDCQAVRGLQKVSLPLSGSRQHSYPFCGLEDGSVWRNILPGRGKPQLANRGFCIPNAQEFGHSCSVRRLVANDSPTGCVHPRRVM